MSGGRGWSSKGGAVNEPAFDNGFVSTIYISIPSQGMVVVWETGRHPKHFVHEVAAVDFVLHEAKIRRAKGESIRIRREGVDGTWGDL